MTHTECSDCGIELTTDNVYTSKSKRCKVCQNEVEKARYRRKARRQHWRQDQRYSNWIDPSEYGVYVNNGQTQKAMHD